MLRRKPTIHQVTTMLATFKNVLVKGHIHLLTTGTDVFDYRNCWQLTDGQTDPGDANNGKDLSVKAKSKHIESAKHCYSPKNIENTRNTFFSCNSVSFVAMLGRFWMEQNRSSITHGRNNYKTSRMKEDNGWMSYLQHIDTHANTKQ